MKISSVFKTRQPTNNAIVQLVNKIFDSFEKQQFTVGVFIDFSKAFDTVDHSILIKKLKLYGIIEKNLAWSQIYLSNEKQYIQRGENSKTDLKYVTWGILKGPFMDNFCFQYILMICQMHLACQIQLCLLMILIFSLITRTLKHLFTIVNKKLVNIKD